MTDWADATTISTSWNEGSTTKQRSITYNTSSPYNTDYLTYNGSYITNEIDWNTGMALETTWN